MDACVVVSRTLANGEITDSSLAAVSRTADSVAQIMQADTTRALAHCNIFVGFPLVHQQSCLLLSVLLLTPNMQNDKRKHRPIGKHEHARKSVRYLLSSAT